MPKQNQTGGVGFTELYRGDNKAAFDFFMNNAISFQIMTDNSISALTLLVELLPDVESPYICLDPASPNFMTSVRKILLKILPSHDTGDFRIDSPVGVVKRSQILKADRFYNSIEINSVQQIKRECDIQKDLYRESMLGFELPLVPICPAILYLENKVSDHEQFLAYLEDKVSERGLNDYRGNPINDVEIIQSFLHVKIPNMADRNIKQYGGVGTPRTPSDAKSPKAKKGKKEKKGTPNEKFEPYPGFGWLLSPLKQSSPFKQPVVEQPERYGNYSILAMEYLDGYTTLDNIKQEIEKKYKDNPHLKDDILNKINLFVSFEVRRLHRLGYYHNDLHTGNIMINQTALFATTDPDDITNTGKIMIIDFGRVLDQKHKRIPRVCKTNLNSDECINREFIFSKFGFILKSIDECVALMAKIQSVAESRKMAICAGLGIANCADRDLGRIVLDELSDTQLILSGGGKPRRTTQITPPIFDPELLKQVFINSLRQTDTYDELYQYLLRYTSKYSPTQTTKHKSPIKIGYTMKTGMPSIGQLLHQPSTAISVMSGGRHKKSKTQKLQNKRC